MINFLIPESNPEKETDLRSQGLGNDVVCNAVNNIKAPKKTFIVVGLGNTDQLFDYSGNKITVDQLAKMIENHPAYSIDLKIKLFVCNSGYVNEWYSYFAQHLACSLKKTVYAPYGVLWIHPDGTTVVTSEHYAKLDDFDWPRNNSKFIKFTRYGDVKEFKLTPRFFRKKTEDVSDFVRLSSSVYLSGYELEAALARAEKGSSEDAFRVYRHYSIAILDIDSANYWLKKAASLGHPIALYNYGLSCLDWEDLTMPKNETLGISLIEQAKDKGHQKAIALLEKYNERPDWA